MLCLARPQDSTISMMLSRSDWHNYVGKCLDVMVRILVYMDSRGVQIRPTMIQWYSIDISTYIRSDPF